MSRRVLVTRPEPGASATARALEAEGYEPVVLPLTAMRPLPVGPVDTNRFSAVAATSVNALVHAPPDLLKRLLHLPLFAVGGATAEAARQAGFSNVETGPGAATALASLIAAKLPVGSTIAYLCGVVRKADMETGLTAADIQIAPVETYASVRIAPSATGLRALSAAPLSATLVFSEEGAKALTDLRQMPDIAAALASALHVCISDAAARPLPRGTLLRIASSPTEAAMLAALADI